MCTDGTVDGRYSAAAFEATSNQPFSLSAKGCWSAAATDETAGSASRSVLEKRILFAIDDDFKRTLMLDENAGA
jgi:hypothetical protein